ncbi:ABC transporter ATP-binding protein [Clostridium sp. JN-9]|nr:ABC transporter ATP-binding protein [Clostridium sp. JN-9]
MILRRENSVYILKLDNVSKSFGKNKVLDNISFSINEGEIVGFVGPNGVGKTTTIRIITNLIHPDKGNINICGYDLQKEREKALSCISAIVENPGLYTFLSGKDNVDFIRKINSVSKEKMNDVINYMGLSNRINDIVKTYSLGMKQRLALGICLLTEPKLLILDEPTNGLDPSGTIELRKTIVNLSKKNKMSIFMSSHVLSEVEKICDRVIFIKDGRINSIKSNENIKNSQTFKVYIAEVEKAEKLIKNCDFINGYTINNNEFLINMDNKNLNDLLKLFMHNELDYTGIEIVNSMLEDEYSKIYGGK